VVVCDAEAAVRAAGMNVGDCAERTRRGEARDIELFTERTGDCNTLHYDAELAARRRLGGSE
jgi:acyl dehydratase